MMELLSPAGSREALIAAVQNGADAVYFGGSMFNARRFAANFDDHGLISAIDYCHERGVKVNITLNTLLLDKEISQALKYAEFLCRTGADAAIVQDMGLVSLIRKNIPELPLHASTQMGIHELNGAREAEKLGLEQVVLSREVPLGEIEYENFNAAAVTLTVEGVNIHPGSAKNKMKNAILLANQFISLLPAAEAPAHTEGYEGFYHVTDLAGNESQVVLHAIIRDHDLEKFNARKAFVERLTAYLNARWGQGTFRLEMKDSYYNMKEKIRPHMELIENAKAAMEAVGVEPVIVPIRGGTDGARLSWERDIPCPNLCTGGANFHGVHEFIPVPSMEKMVQVLVELVKA